MKWVGIMEGKRLGKRINMVRKRPGIHGGQALGTVQYQRNLPPAD